MRFISHIRRFQVQIQARRVQYLLNGVEQEVIPGILAEFVPGDVTAYELEYAEKVFAGELNGRTVEIDEVTPTSLLSRLSTFDTDMHDEEYAALDAQWGAPSSYDPSKKFSTHREMVEAKLKDRQSGEMKLVEELPVAAPWPNYDTFRGSVDDLVEKLVDDGYHLPQAIAYERQNLNRANVLEALEAMRDAQMEDLGAEDVVAA